MKRVSVFIALVLVTGLLFAAGSAESKPAAAAGLNIAIITTPSGVDDGSFNQDNYNGILAFVKNHPTAKVTAIREPSGDVAAALKAAADVVAEYDVLVCTGFQFAGIGELAMENPDTKFILVDTYPTDAKGNTVELPNVYAMTFAEQESGFFAGVAAALETKTNKVAVVNGVAYPSNVNYQYGFECGVIYANKKLGTNAQVVELASRAGTDVTGANVGGNYAGSFADEATGKVIGQQLLAQGVDIIFVAAGATGNGVFTAAKESNGRLKVIGCDVDQWDDGTVGSGNIILTSVLKVMSLNVERVLNQIQDGTFKGANMLLKADTDSTGFVKKPGRNQLSPSTIQKLDEAYTLVQKGVIVPASNFGGFTPEQFQVN
ncbi:BMP family ABC transporter substrate-binding protein [uncultured Sphaerochaeta sp.]|uniref:BMP family lipoprotein n=1 Tax=uncultured Sphaerochaeta sp. TaxID=886478 RepID=UPI002602E31E|nr:BMP family ABC transporter substrate-binding protein [uncultured Sphaerochaeta sp.]